MSDYRKHSAGPLPREFAVLPREMEVRRPVIRSDESAAAHFLAWTLYPQEEADEYDRLRFLHGYLRKRAEEAGTPPRDQPDEFKRRAPGGPSRLNQYIDRGRRRLERHRAPVLAVALRMLETRGVIDGVDGVATGHSPDRAPELRLRDHHDNILPHGAQTVDGALRYWWEQDPDLPYQEESNARTHIVRPSAPLLPMLLALLFDYRTLSLLDERVTQAGGKGPIYPDGPLARYDTFRALLDDASWAAGAIAASDLAARRLIPYLIPNLIPAVGPIYVPRLGP